MYEQLPLQQPQLSTPTDGGQQFAKPQFGGEQQFAAQQQPQLSSQQPQFSSHQQPQLASQQQPQVASQQQPQVAPQQLRYGQQSVAGVGQPSIEQPSAQASGIERSAGQLGQQPQFVGQQPTVTQRTGPAQGAHASMQQQPWGQTAGQSTVLSPQGIPQQVGAPIQQTVPGQQAQGQQPPQFGVPQQGIAPATFGVPQWSATTTGVQQQPGQLGQQSPQQIQQPSHEQVRQTVELAETPVLAEALARRLGISSQQLSQAIPQLGAVLGQQYGPQQSMLGQQPVTHQMGGQQPVGQQPTQIAYR